MYTYSVLKTHMVKHSSNRRSFMKASGTAGVALSIGVTGCLGEEDTPTPDSDDDDGNGTSANGNGGNGGTDSLSVGFSHYPVIPHGLPLTVGMEEGFFEDNGVSVDDIVSTDGGGGGVRTITTGDIEVGMSPPNATAQAFNQGAPLHIVGMATAVPDIDYQTRVDSDIEEIQDVETIAVTDPASSGEANAVLSIEAADGISLDDIEFLYTGGLGEVMSAVREGIADVGLNTNPTSTEMLRNEETRRVWHTRDYVEEYTEDILSMGNIILDQEPELARGFLQGWIDSSEWIHDNVDEAGRLWAAEADFDEELAIAGLEDTQPEAFFQIGMSEEFADNLERVLQFDGTLEEDEELEREELFRDEYLPEEYQSDWL
ncbi:ABC transporter substrate-binding protein [Natrialba swarupiae]|uniref:ABC transporter substrate-binding protein n=1 Tax=Natrialba swarupiae TaxID=2448032 RepID=A0A5D5AU91_9EURY|nr:ABC transporter substrate-binding protein [Natrialba swarupiae]